MGDMCYWLAHRKEACCTVLVTSVCVTVVTWTPWDLCVTGWPTEGKHVALCVSDLSLCYSGYMDTIGPMCYWLTYRRKHVALCVSDLSLCYSSYMDTMGPMSYWLTYRRKHAALCISDLSLSNMLQWIYWHHAEHALLAGTQREACCTVTSVCVAVASSTPCSPCVAGWHTGWRGVDVAGPQVEPDEDVPAPQSPVIVWKDPALRASVHSQSHKDTSTSMGSCTDGEHILPCGCSSDLGSISVLGSVPFFCWV